MSAFSGNAASLAPAYEYPRAQRYPHVLRGRGRGPQWAESAPARWPRCPEVLLDGGQRWPAPRAWQMAAMEVAANCDRRSDSQLPHADATGFAPACEAARPASRFLRRRSRRETNCHCSGPLRGGKMCRRIRAEQCVRPLLFGLQHVAIRCEGVERIELDPRHSVGHRPAFRAFPFSEHTVCSGGLAPR